MKTRAILFSFLTALLVPLSLPAQEDEDERGQLLFIQVIDVMPEDVMAYENAMSTVVKAAGAAQLSEGFKWSIWNDDFTYTLVFPIKEYAYFDTPDQWMKQFEGTAGEAVLQEAFQAFSEVDMRVRSTEIVEHVEDWTYSPPTPVEGADYAHVHSFRIKPNQDEAFGEVIKDISAFFGDLDYPYALAGHRTHFGDSGLATFVIWHDDPGAYHGANNIDNLVEKKMMGDRWSELMGRLAKTILGSQHGDQEYKPELSYWPMPEGATNE